MPERPDYFASNVQAQLEERHWSGPELARRAGLSPKTVNNVLKGRHAYQVDVQRKIAKALGMEVWQLWLPALPKDMAHDATFPNMVAAASRLDPKAIARIADQVELETLRAKSAK